MRNTAKRLLIAALVLTAAAAPAQAGYKPGYFDNNGWRDFGFCHAARMLGDGTLLLKPCFFFY